MNIAIIFAGGVGKRMTNVARPKQFLKLYGKEIIIHTLEHFEFCEEIDVIIIACIKEWIPYLQKLVKQYEIKKIKSIIPGGHTGQESIYLGLREAARLSLGDDDIVLIHDGVRPFIDDSTIKKNIKSVKNYGSAITVTPSVETIIRLDNGKIVDTIDRTNVGLARAPQSFFLRDILRVHEMARRDGHENFIDCATMMNYYGMQLVAVEGPVENIKITTPKDFLVSKAFYEAEEQLQLFGI